MSTPLLRATAPLALLALAGALGCGGGGSSGGPGGGGGGGQDGKDGWGSPVTAEYPSAVTDLSQCQAFPAADDHWRWGLDGYWTGSGLAVWMDASYFPDHAQPSFFVIKLLSDPANWYSGPPDMLMPQTITFGPDAGKNARMETCEVCPVLVTNVWGDNPTGVWYPIAGTLTIEQANTETLEIVGSVKDLVFKRIGIYGVASFANWVTDPDPIHPDQPPCAYLAESHFDTRRVDGRPCKVSDDCPNSNYHVCDADTATCVGSQCDQGKRWDGAKGDWVTTQSACPTGKECEIQIDLDTWYYGTHIEHALTTGACVTPCDGGAMCASGQVCEMTDALVGGGSGEVCHVAP